VNSNVSGVATWGVAVVRALTRGSDEHEATKAGARASSRHKRVAPGCVELLSVSKFCRM